VHGGIPGEEKEDVAAVVPAVQQMQILRTGRPVLEPVAA